MKTADEYKLTDTDTNGCEGCWHSLHAGIRWPASPDGFTDLSYVDRCDYCELYESDEEAAKALADHYGVRWGYGDREAICAAEQGDPTLRVNIRWAPEEDDGLDYTGWSAFIDHPARDDGDSKYLQPMFAGDSKSFAPLHLNPGQARALIYALTEARANMGPEWGSGEFWALATGATLEELREMVRDMLGAKQ